MAVNTQNIDLVKPGTEEFYDVNIMNSNLDKIDSYTGEIKNKLENGFIQEKALQLGYNRIQIPEIPVSPKIEFTGYSYTNLLGRDGHSNISKWNQNQFIVATIDTTYTQIGQNSIKLTLSNPWATFARRMHSVSFGNTKYYMFSAYIRNGNAANIGIYKDDTGGGVPIQSNVISDTTKFTRVVFKTAPGEIVGDDWFAVQVSGSAGQYAYVDGIMLNEIPANDYSLSDTELMAKYPYVDSYACLTNPYFENRRYNLVRNGNCEEGIGYWKNEAGNNTLSVENGKFKLVTTAISYRVQYVSVIPNTVYYAKCNAVNGRLQIANELGTIELASNGGTFNSGTNTKVQVRMFVTNAATAYFDSIMLIEGTTAPSEYKSCDLQRFAVEGQYTQDDKIVIENGKVSGLINWKHTTLFGKDFDWRFMGDHPGCKCVGIPIEAFPEAYTSGPIGNRLVKPNGEMANEGPVGGGIVNNFNLTTTAGGLVFNISDNDTGWDENINPGIDEVKAFMNGWKAAWNDGTRYTLWRTVGTPASTGLADYPAGTATTLTAASDGSASITVEDASVFKVGDGIAVIGIVPTIVSGINGNVITTVDTIASGGEIGNIVARLDTPATDSRILNYCKNNIAPGYEGYKLHYKLASPKPVTDINTVIKGEIWDLVKGDNYLTVDSGIMLDETANPVLYNGGYFVGYYNNGYYPTLIASAFKYKSSSSIQIKKNGILDLKWTVVSWPVVANYGYASILQADFDTNSTYTADYQILKTLHAQGFGSLVISYPQSIISALEGHSKALEHKQTKNSTLDTIIDLSMYEEIGFEMTGRILQSSAYNGYVYYDIRSIIQKKCVPQFTIKNPTAVALNGSSGVLSIPPIDYMLFFAGGLQNQTRYLKLKFIYTGSDSIIKSCIANYGFIVTCTVIADCRGRV